MDTKSERPRREGDGAMTQVRDHCLGPARARRRAAGRRPVFGQYLAHDLTADRSPLAHHDDAELLRNARSARLDLGWAGETPLWYYLLREAAVLEDGERLGPVGSLIVGEVLLAVIDRDPGSQRSADPDWRPTLPGRQPGRFTLTDLLAPA
jgi:hypothetical protein